MAGSSPTFRVGQQVIVAFDGEDGDSVSYTGEYKATIKTIHNDGEGLMVNYDGYPGSGGYAPIEDVRPIDEEEASSSLPPSCFLSTAAVSNHMFFHQSAVGEDKKAPARKATKPARKATKPVEKAPPRLLSLCLVISNIIHSSQPVVPKIEKKTTPTSTKRTTTATATATIRTTRSAAESAKPMAKRLKQTRRRLVKEV